MLTSRVARTAYAITEKFNPFMTKGGYEAAARTVASTGSQQRIHSKTGAPPSTAGGQQASAVKK